MNSRRGRRRPSVDDVIQQLQNVNLRDQLAEQEETCLQEERLHLRAEGARLIRQLAITRAADRQAADENAALDTRPFAIGIHRTPENERH